MQPDPSMIELPPLPPPSTWEGCELHEDYCASEDSWDRDAMRSYGEACARAALEAAAERVKDIGAYCGGHGEPSMPGSSAYVKAILGLKVRHD
jgi:hypothetical protein